MSEVTRILQSIQDGEPEAAEQLLPLVYGELRKLAAARIAQENPGQTLQATALVHEAYLRLVDVEQMQTWDGRRHFFAAAAQAMRRILVEQARRKGRLKRGGDLGRVELDDVPATLPESQLDLIALDEALTKLAEESPQLADIVQLRFFAGLEHSQIAEAVGVSTITVKRQWRYARVWLLRHLEGRQESPT